MSDKEKKIVEAFGKVIPKLSENKKEYLLGVADGMAVMAERKEQEETE